MLISLTKFLAFVAIIIGVIFGIDLLMREGEGLRLAVANTEFTLGPVQTLVAVILLLVTVWLVLKLLGLTLAVLRFLTGDETAITRYFARSRERRGFKALSDGMTALASGDGAEAMVNASKAERLLKRPDLTNLIKAQAAEMSGNKAQATFAYKKLLEDDRTRFVGVRGLMKQKIDEGDTDTALKLAEKAFVLKPRHDEVSDTLLRLQAKSENWHGARKTLGAKLKYGSIPRDLHKRRDAVLALSESSQRMAAGEESAAHDEAIEANRLAPGLVPAAVMAARAYIDMDKPRNAAKVLKTAWGQNPHPELAAAYAEIDPDETPATRVRRFADLTKVKPEHPETRMLLAELEIAAENFPTARKALGDLPEKDPTARSLTLMAAIERGMGAPDDEVKAWLAKALTASRGPQWICDNCAQVHRAWVPVCTNCDGFDTLAWKTASDGHAIAGTSAAMLPLIVGSLDRGDAGIAPAPVTGDPANTPTNDAPVDDTVIDATGATVAGQEPKMAKAAN